LITSERHSQKILAIGMVDSIHFARWLSAMQGFDAEITIVPSGPNRRRHRVIKGLTQTHGKQFRLSTASTIFSLPVWILDRPLKGRLRALILFFKLRSGAYDIIHFHEMQSGGYPLALLPRAVLQDLKICYTPYGSDLFWFSRFPTHLQRIKQTLKVTDLIFPECERDAVVAIDAGFSGKIGPTMAAGGVFEFSPMQKVDFGSRKKILLKGYGGTWGRAILALRSLEKVQNELIDYEIHVMSVTRDVEREISRLKRSSSLRLISHPKFSLTSDEVRALLLGSKYYLALSESDGFPASLMEAMMCGAVPIHSDTACLPKSLIALSPENFVPKFRWSEVGEILTRFDRTRDNTESLSKSFCAWAEEHQLSAHEFRALMSESYASR